MSNTHLLLELNKGNRWVHVKSKPIFCKKLEKNCVIQTLEGTEEISAGDWVCKGLKGELWSQKEEELFRKYKRTKVIDQAGWIKFIPDPSNKGFFAVSVRNQEGFTVHTARGDYQEGKKGDFVLKNFQDQAVEFPADVWIVNKEIYKRTFTRVPKDAEVQAALMFMQDLL
eukprot:TRINITY_DN3073_c0_g1_i1.p1 TRINITY_DN3073_c0_g1~~TRINITY_DN3073_c0_g1_i1.p1  ORF type:complete len:170 (-),score=16.26 TRINITY_DN3073_c0_g1_i1:115-624(-)